MHKGKYLQTSSGTNLGPGHFVSLLESAAEKTAKVLGKPNNSFFLSALGNISPGETVMIGDDFAGISILYFLCSCFSRYMTNNPLVLLKIKKLYLINFKEYLSFFAKTIFTIM